MNQPPNPPTTPGELPPITSRVLYLMALRQQRLNNVVFSRAGLPLRITPQVELYLAAGRRLQQYEAQQRQAEIDALPPLEWLKATLAQARAQVDAANLVAERSGDPATIATALARVEGLLEYVREIDQKLAEMSAEGALDNA